MYCSESIHVAPLTDSAGESRKCAVTATAMGAINFHQGGWSVCPFPLSPLLLLLEEDNEGDGELCNATNTPLVDRCIKLRLWY